VSGYGALPRNTVESTLVRTLHHWTDALNVKILRSAVTECQLLWGSSIVRIDGWFTDWWSMWSTHICNHFINLLFLVPQV